ncbi:TetR/AcrR family transcriptional regulator [Terribacillus saccharophilus]|uniref:TetR/AcrR family transcriptional regulator n=1 Tax=Terribacillus saccharophilus TaxID=361277 RepID=UPI00398278C6
MERRKRKTQKLIINTFLKLLHEKTFDKITVNQLTKSADINRGTFYLHYQDKYALLEETLKDYINQMNQYCLHNKEEISHALTLAFDYLKDNYKFIEPLLRNEGYQLFQNELKSSISTFIETSDLVDLHVVSILKKKAITSTILGVIEWWLLEDELKASPSDIAAELEGIVFSIIR